MCDSAPCKNGATCVEKFPEEFECECVAGYAGETCSEGLFHSKNCYELELFSLKTYFFTVS